MYDLLLCLSTQPMLLICLQKTVVANSMTATPVLPQGVTPKRPAALSRLQDEEDEMPKTPELTMSYKR